MGLTITPPSYFTRHDIYELLRDDEFPYIQEKIEEVSEEVFRRVDEIERDAKDNHHTMSDLSKRNLDALQEISFSLASLESMLVLYEQQHAGRLCIWTPPRDKDGNIRNSEIIPRPTMEPLNLMLHSVLISSGHRENPARAKRGTSPLLFDKDVGDVFNELVSVEEVVMNSEGEIEDFNKANFRDKLNILKQERTDESLLELKNLGLEEIIDFFNKPNIAALYAPPNDRYLS